MEAPNLMCDLERGRTDTGTMTLNQELEVKYIPFEKDMYVHYQSLLFLILSFWMTSTQ